MKQLEKILESKTKIRFGDCDPFNHLNNSRYIDYFIYAREDQLLEHYDFDVYRIAREQGINWVMAQNQIAYMAPANLMETVVIQTRLLAYNDKSLTLEALMWNEDKTVLKAISWAVLVHIDLRTMKSRVHAPELTELFSQILYPHVGILSFEDRLKTLRKERPAPAL